MFQVSAGGEANEGGQERHMGPWQMFGRWSREAVENHMAEGRGDGGLLFSHLGGNNLPSNKLLSRSWFYKLTLLDGGMKGIAKGMGSTLPLSPL